MSRVLVFVVLCVALAVLRAVLIVLAIATVLALLYAFIVRPREMLIFMGVLVLSAVAVARPLAFIVCVGGLGVTFAMSRKPRTVPRSLVVLGGRKRN